MVSNQWYAVLDSQEVKKNKLLGVTRLGERLVFWRNCDNEIVCFKDRCVHRGASLAIGKHCGDSIACPFHGFKYDSQGRVVLVPANGKQATVPGYFTLDTYPVKESQGMVFIFWGDKREQAGEVPHFEDIDDGFSVAATVHHWPVHYSRAIENQLDLIHLPFVHYNTIGKGNRTLVNGPVELVDNLHIRFWVYNEKDIGQIPKKAEELPPPDKNRQHIHFIFPNIWQNWILPNLRIFVAFVPIDESNTRVYLRTLQKIVLVPGLRKIFDSASMYFSVKILNQDRRVVLTQVPIKTELKMDEKLIHGDLPIVTYRRMRDELKN
jgi:phenylpropionate dioxygenase-like ring-hydroxylating dioxygenase large terminal subunit